MTDEDEREPDELQERRRKPYQSPSLVRLGSLRRLTLKVGWRGRSDGGRFPRGFRTSY